MSGEALEIAIEIHADLHDKQCTCGWAIPRMTEAIEDFTATVLERKLATLCTSIATHYNTMSDEEYWLGGRAKKEAAAEIVEMIREELDGLKRNREASKSRRAQPGDC